MTRAQFQTFTEDIVKAAKRSDLDINILHMVLNDERCVTEFWHAINPGSEKTEQFLEAVDALDNDGLRGYRPGTMFTTRELRA